MRTATLLVDSHPDLAAEWHPTRNAGLDVAALGTFSNKKVWWLHVDARGDVHEWQQIIRNRTYTGSGCATCSRHDPTVALAPFAAPEPGRSLADRAAGVAAMWGTDRNGPLRPEQVTLRSTRHVWWRCEHGHEWVRTITSQAAAASRGKACKSCPGTDRDVPTERARRAARLLTEVAPLVAAQWHPTRNGDLRPDQVTASATTKVWWTAACGHAWKASVKSRAIDGSGCNKCRGDGAGARFAAWKNGGSSSLADKAPHIAAEWHPTKNGDLTPADVSYGSATRVWWRCAVGHEWNNTVNSRTGRNRGCWCCSHPSSVPSPETVIDPALTLAAADPALAAQWHPTRNGLATPDSIHVRSEQRAWWLCQEGHRWQSRVAGRHGSEHGCRACANTAERARRAA